MTDRELMITGEACSLILFLKTHCLVRLWREAQEVDLCLLHSLRLSVHLQTHPWTPGHPGERRSSPLLAPGYYSVKHTHTHIYRTQVLFKQFFSNIKVNDSDISLQCKILLGNIHIDTTSQKPPTKTFFQTKCNNPDDIGPSSWTMSAAKKASKYGSGLKKPRSKSMDAIEECCSHEGVYFVHNNVWEDMGQRTATRILGPTRTLHFIHDQYHLLDLSMVLPSLFIKIDI